VADFDMSPNPANVNQTIQFTDLSAGATSWNWDFGDEIGTSVLQHPTYAYSDTGVYTVVLTISNDGGCSDTAMKDIAILDQNVEPVDIPSAFTPNGDGINDVFRVLGGPFNDFDFRVFNEWGNQIFKSTSQDIGWDGTIKNKLQPAGTYVFVFKGERIDGETYEMTGDITLINLQKE